MLYDPPIAGSTPVRIKGPDQFLNLGKKLDVYPGDFEFALEVSPNMENYREATPLDWLDPPRVTNTVSLQNEKCTAGCRYS